MDAWVKNAGRGITRPVSQLTDEDLDGMMLFDAKAVLYGMQAVRPHFKQRGRGHIINVSSMLRRVPLLGLRCGQARHERARRQPEDGPA